MSLSASLRAPDRHLSLSGSILCLTGQSLSFSGSQALAFSMSEGASSGNLLGGAFSAACSLTLDDRDERFTLAASPYGAQVTVRLTDGEESAPLVTFTVTKVTKRENDPRLTLSGSDALAAAFDGVFEDDFTYPLPLLDIARGIATQAGFSLWNDDFPNASFTIPVRPDWGDISLRQALAFAACAAGSFAQIGRDGHLVFRPVRDPSAPPAVIGPDMTLSHEGGARSFGPLAALRVKMTGSSRGAQPLTVMLQGASPGPYNTLSVSGNPLFPQGGSHTEALAQALLAALSGYTLTDARVTWRGDPALCLGAPVRILDSRNVITDTVVTAQSFSFQRGFSMQTECASPLAAPSVGKIFTSSGALNASLLDGSLNGAIIRDGSIAASSLMAGSVSALQLAAGSVTAEKIGAQAVTSEKISASAVTADKLSAGAVTAEKIAASAIDALYAGLATANISWADIQTLRAAVADLADARIAGAEIDWAQIKDLVSHRAIITQGEAGEMYIARLAVTEANLLSLTVGEIMVRGADGGFYALTVDGEGNVSAARKQVQNADVQDGAIDGGQKLMAGSVTARALNAQEIFGDNATIRRLIAESLDVDTLFAREAVISRLNALDITGNDSIRLYVQHQDQMNAYLRVTENGLEIGRVGDTARFRADNRTLDVTNVKTERLGVTQKMGMPEEWAWIATKTGIGLKYLG